MKPTRMWPPGSKQQSVPATCRAWQYHDDTPLSYVRCDTPLHMEVSSKRIIVACPWHPDKIYDVLPETEAPLIDPREYGASEESPWRW